MHKFLLRLGIVILLFLPSCENQDWQELTRYDSVLDIGILSNPIGNTLWVMPVGVEYIFQISGVSVSPPVYTSFENSRAGGAICASKSYVYLAFGEGEVKRYSPEDASWKSYPEFKNIAKGKIYCTVAGDSESVVLWSSGWIAYASDDEFVIVKSLFEYDINSVFISSENKIYLLMSDGKIVDFYDQRKVVYPPKTHDTRSFLGNTSNNILWFAEGDQIVKLDLDSVPVLELPILNLDPAKFGQAEKIIEVDDKRTWLTTSSESIFSINKQRLEMIVTPKQYGNILFVVGADDYIYMSTTEGIYILGK